MHKNDRVACFVPALATLPRLHAGAAINAMSKAVRAGAPCRSKGVLGTLLRQGFAGLAAALLFLASGSAAAVEVVRFPLPESADDKRFDYPRQLLELALSKTKTEYRLTRPAHSMTQTRQLTELEAGRTIDVAPLPSSADREARLLPIRIPLNKGLLGWRLGLVRKGDTHRLAQVKTQADIKSVRLAQGQDWPDTQILAGNGLEIIKGSNYEGLFKMLESQRFDYFPRSVMEIWDEQKTYAGTLEIEPHIALHYFYDSYFFVNKHNTKLAADIAEGLEKAIADGSFDKLFDEHWGERVRRARLNERTVIELRNPLLTPETPSHRRELWYDVRR